MPLTADDLAQILKEATLGVPADKSRYKDDPEFPVLRAKIEANLAETEETYPDGHYHRHSLRVARQ